MDKEPVTRLRRRQELTILTDYSESVFLLASQMSIGRKPVELLPAEGRGHVLQCEWPRFQRRFEGIMFSVSQMLQKFGVCRVGRFWSEPSPVFEVDFDAKGSIQQLVKALESGKVCEEMKSIIFPLVQRAWWLGNPDARFPEWDLDISLELLQVLPNVDTKDAIIHRVSSANISMCAGFWNERKVFDIGALLRCYRSKPLGGGHVGASPAASENIQLMALMRELNEVVGWMWLGLQLGVPKHTLDTIHSQYAVHGEQMCKIEMLNTWLNSRAEEPTWAEVVSAVSRTGNKRVARRIANKYGLALAVLTEANTATKDTPVSMEMTGQLESLNRKMEDTYRAVEDSDSQMQLNTRKKEKLECDVAEIRDNSDIVRNYIEALNKGKESVEQKLEEKEKEIRSLHSEQLIYERTIRALEVKLAKASAKAKHKLEDKLQLVNNEKKELVKQVEARQKEVDELQEQISKLILKLERAKQELSDAQNQLELKTSQLSEVQQQLQSIQNQRDELKQQLEMQEKSMREAIMRHIESDEVAGKARPAPQPPGLDRDVSPLPVSTIKNTVATPRSKISPGATGVSISDPTRKKTAKPIFDSWEDFPNYPSYPTHLTPIRKTPLALLVYSPETPEKEIRVLMQLVVRGLSTYAIEVMFPDCGSLRGSITDWVAKQFQMATGVLIVCNQQLHQDWNSEGRPSSVVAALKHLTSASVGKPEFSYFALVLMRVSDEKYIPTPYLENVVRFTVDKVEDMARFFLEVPTYVTTL